MPSRLRLALVALSIAVAAYGARWQYGTIENTSFRVNRWTGRTELFTTKGWLLVHTTPNATFPAP